MPTHINRVTLTGNLTRDPELTEALPGRWVCRLRLAVTGGRRDRDTGEWIERVHFFDVAVWGRSGEACATHLRCGAPVAVDGRLSWSAYEAADGGRREAVAIVADAVQFLGRPPQAGAEHEEVPEPAVA